ncbi:methyltransferase domain-containing protein [Streptomyces sp. NBC_01232]|uniref:methyltransferase domain-containing protein n=1 Tax=unclassified Streptomyces TaxID=2593676 RepID=UPI002E14FA5B|nr:methyltransferase domain-containing protein [Streptomyces sp. NBC_01232]
MTATVSGGSTAAARAAAAGRPVPGRVVVGPEDLRYDELVRGDNYRFVGRPDHIELVSSTEQVADALERALAAGKRVAVRSGGHCGEAFVADPAVEVVIDLSLMAQVYHDPELGAVAIEAGATVGHVYKTLYRNWGVTLPAGVCTAVGAGGHITGGGYGPLSRMHGLVADHLYAVEVVHVAACGTVRTVVATREPDDPNRALWWAHTGGGGGNFGIVTRFWMRSPGASGTDPAQLLPKPPGALLIAMVNWSWEQCDLPAFTRLIGNFMAWHVEHSGVGSPYAGLFASLWVRHRSGGDLTMYVQMDATAPDASDRLEEFLAAVDEGVGAQPFVFRTRLPWLTGVRYMGQGDSGPVLGARSKSKAAYLRDVHTDEQIASLYRSFTSEDYFGRESLMMLNGYGGAINAVAPADTSSAQRDSVIKAAYSAAWSDPAEDDLHIAWVRGLYAGLYADTGGVPVSGARTDGSYINYPDIDLADPEQNTSGVPWHQLYYKDNYAALQVVKATWDPRDVFHHDLSVRLPSSGPAQPVRSTNRAGESPMTFSTDHIPDRYDFERMYAGDADAPPVQPWDIGRPQPALVAVQEAGLITGDVLDVGCGLGDNAAFLASKGHRVTAVDVAETAVEVARRRAAARGVQVEFVIGDATRLSGLAARFDTVVDSACFHALAEDERLRYLEVLHDACRPGARLHMFCFAEELEAPFPGPHRHSAQSLREVVGAVWDVVSVEAAAYASSLAAEDVVAMIKAEYPDSRVGEEGIDGLALDEFGNATMPVWHVTAERRG